MSLSSKKEEQFRETFSLTEACESVGSCMLFLWSTCRLQLSTFRRGTGGTKHPWSAEGGACDDVKRSCQDHWWKSREYQLRLVVLFISLSYDLKGFRSPRWCRISNIKHTKGSTFRNKACNVLKVWHLCWVHDYTCLEISNPFNFLCFLLQAQNELRLCREASMLPRF